MKKIIALLLVIALTAALSVSLTMAYLQDTDDDVNVMTLGNVYIEQHEYQRVVDADGSFKTDTIDDQNSYVLESFKQGKPLYPIVGDPSLSSTDPGYAGWDSTVVRMTQVDSYGYMQVFAGKNAQDKFVTVENTGKSAAYVRTIVALEIGEADANLIGISARATDKPTESTAPWIVNNIGTIEIDENNYLVKEYIYRGASDVSRHVNGILPAGETTYPSLCQVYLPSAATNEDVEKLDGNKNGTFDILVLSQAVQVEGFANATEALNAAFGVANAENAAKWFGGMTIPSAPFVSTVDELKAALEAGNSVSLATDLELTEAFSIPAGKNATIDLAGNELSLVSTEAEASCAIENKGTLTIKNGTVTYEGVGDPNFGYGTNTINNSGKLIIDGATIINTTNSGSSNAIDNAPGSELIVNSGTIKSEKVTIRLRDGSSATINGGEISGARAVQIHLFQNVAADTKLTINGGTFTGDYALYSYAYGNVTFARTTIEINGGTFNGIVAFGGGNKTEKEAVIINGGTFNGDLGRYLENDGWEDIDKP